MYLNAVLSSVIVNVFVSVVVVVVGFTVINNDASFRVTNNG